LELFEFLGDGELCRLLRFRHPICVIDLGGNLSLLIGLFLSFLVRDRIDSLLESSIKMLSSLLCLVKDFIFTRLVSEKVFLIGI
jgi:hypothetical protein